MPPQLEVFAFFASLSFLAVGGGAAVLPDIQRMSVDVRGWLTPGEFTDLFAITRMTPGPSMLFVLLIGYKACGIPGAALAGLGFFGPTSLLAYLLQRAPHGRPTRWRRALDRALPSIAVGTLLATCRLLSQSMTHGPVPIVLILLAGVALASGRFSLLRTMVACGLLGWLLLTP